MLSTNSFLIHGLLASQCAAWWPWSPFDTLDVQIRMNDSCQVSHVTAYEVHNRPIHVFQIDSENPLYSPKLKPLNKTAGEQWEFDGIGESAKTGIIIGFYRDPNYEILGTGNLRVSVDVLLENGTTYSQDHHVAHSILEVCTDVVRGTWFSNDAKYSFAIARDQSHARVDIATANLRGYFTVEATSSARYPDVSVFPQSASTTEISPFMNWVSGIPTGRIDLDMTVAGEGVAWRGLGGSERLWSAFSWFTILDELYIVRSELGPFQLTCFAVRSRLLTPGALYVSAGLSVNGEKVFTAVKAHVSATESYAVLTSMYDGNVTGSLADRSTGFALNLISPVDGKHWHFELDFSGVLFEFALGDGTGGTGFAARAVGGEMDQEQYEGVALTEKAVFPKDGWLFKSNYA